MCVCVRVRNIEALAFIIRKWSLTGSLILLINKDAHVFSHAYHHAYLWACSLWCLGHVFWDSKIERNLMLFSYLWRTRVPARERKRVHLGACACGPNSLKFCPGDFLFYATLLSDDRIQVKMRSWKKTPNNNRNKKVEFRLREHFVLAGENERVCLNSHVISGPVGA